MRFTSLNIRMWNLDTKDRTNEKTLGTTQIFETEYVRNNFKIIEWIREKPQLTEKAIELKHLNRIDDIMMMGHHHILGSGITTFTANIVDDILMYVHVVLFFHLFLPSSSLISVKFSDKKVN